MQAREDITPCQVAVLIATHTGYIIKAILDLVAGALPGQLVSIQGQDLCTSPRGESTQISSYCSLEGLCQIRDFWKTGQPATRILI